MYNCCVRGDVQLLEPCTELVVNVSEEYLGPVLSDLTSQRRAQVKEMAIAMDTRVIHTVVPIASLTVSYTNCSIVCIYCVHASIVCIYCVHRCASCV